MTFTIKPRPTKDGFNLESEALSGRLWYGKVDAAVSYALHHAGSRKATVEVFDAAGALVRKIVHDPKHDAKQSGSALGLL